MEEVEFVVVVAWVSLAGYQNAVTAVPSLREKVAWSWKEFCYETQDCPVVPVHG